LVGFVLAQRWGLFKLLERLLERLEVQWSWLPAGSLSNMHETILALYKDRRGVLLGCFYHLSSWIVGVGEIWLALRLMGVEISVHEAFILESLGQAVRSAAFLVPAALGVQEGGYLLLGAMFGLSPELALALSLVKRVRELLLGLPALLAWQVVEGRRLWLGIGRRGKTTGPRGHDYRVVPRGPANCRALTSPNQARAASGEGAGPLDGKPL
jgi:putative membrane protein